MRRAATRTAFTLVEIVVVMTIIAILMGMLIAGVQSVRSIAYTTDCKNRLRNFIFALQGFEAAKQTLPGSKAALPGRWSIHVETLPYFEEVTLYSTLVIDAPLPTVKEVLVPQKAIIIEDSDPLYQVHNRTRETPVPIFNCPADPASIPFGNNYCPVVTARGARNAYGEHLVSWLPPDDEVSFPLEGPPSETFRKQLRPPALAEIQDGQAQTACLVERVKGILMTDLYTPLNQAIKGGRDSRYLVQGTSIQVANDSQVEVCRNGVMDLETGRLSPSADASGAVWLQHTCRWLGCANMMAPPNTPPCEGQSPGNHASTGSAAASSYHGDGANFGFFDANVRFVPSDIDLRVLHAMGTINGRELHPWVK
ncbi:Hypothetical protein PBC10988_18690 [Planctomycetales bacterium 10988]|nr:Hypothetical protein PBC10988_18690 [Planctomycetales bacterium 10988]